MRLALLLVALIAPLALAGCTGDNTTTTSTSATTTTPVTTTMEPVTSTPATTTTVPTSPTPAITNASFSLETSPVPTLLAVGQAFSFTLFVNGTGSISSDHVGAHYGASSTTTPTTTVYDQACVHVAGTLPGSFLVNCAIATEGAWFLRAHARVTSDNVTFNYWGVERAIQVKFFGVAIDAPPTAVIANQTATYKVNVTGNSTGESQHIGSHWSWNSSANAEATTLLYENTCGHVNGSVPGVFTVSCEFPAGGLAPAKIYLRGHMRLTENGQNANWWSPEYELTVSPGII